MSLSLSSNRRPRGLRRALAGVATVVVALVLYPADVTGTVEEQRARLPPPAECPDPVEGVWKALHYHQRLAEWYEMTLDVRRVTPDGDVLRGEIISHFWDGKPEDPKPPPCRPGGLELVVRMPATGKLVNGKIEFGASTYTTDKTLCGHATAYAPDNFSGKIDPDLQEFQSVNNDGHLSVNEPTVFRRIQCVDVPRKSVTQQVKPPAYAPAEKKHGGCSL